MNAPVLPGPLGRQSAPRSLGVVPFARQGHGLDRPGRARPGRADRHGADRRRRTRRRDGAHRHPLRRHRLTPERGLHRRQPVDPIRRRRLAAGLRRGARAVSRSGRQSPRLRGERACDPRRRHPAQRRADRPGLLDARRRGQPRRQGDRQRGAQASRRLTASSARAAPRLDLPAKIFGEAAFIHDMVLDGMVHARVVRQPNRGATIASIDEAAIRRAAKGADRVRPPRQFPRHRRRRRDGGRAAAAAAPNHVTWQNVETPSPLQAGGHLAAAAAVDRPACSARRSRASRKAASASRRPIRARYLAHASISPSCGLADYRDGHLTVWTHCQGVFPLRGGAGAHAWARCLPPSPCTTCRARAATATTAPTMPPPMPPSSRCRCRASRSACAGGARRNSSSSRKRPAMIVKVRALLDDAGKPDRLDAGNLERHAQQAPGRRRQSAGRGRAAQSAAGAAAERRAGSQRRRRAPATASRSTTFRPSASSIIW